MTGKERFIRTISRQEVDRPSIWLGLPSQEALPKLCSYFHAENENDLRQKLGDDVYPVEIPYHSPVSNAIYAAFDFTKPGVEKNSDRTLTAPGFFENMTSPEDVEQFDWPDPQLYIDPVKCRELFQNAPKDKAVVGIIWCAHFQDTCAAFGMETALVNMLTNPEMYQAVSKKIEDFYIKANEIFFAAAEGRMDAVLIGNDLGSQNSLMLSPELIRKFVLPGTKRFIKQAKQYGLKVIHHSCGAISDIIDDLIDAGADVIHPIQALAAGMEPRSLKERFGTKVSFCGGVDTQYLLIHGSPADIIQKVRELADIFPTGLVISPSHEAILPDVAPENIEALFRALP